MSAFHEGKDEALFSGGEIPTEHRETAKDTKRGNILTLKREQYRKNRLDISTIENVL